jgi:hypothetical protein
MKNNRTASNRKTWNDQHSLLRGLLGDTQNFPEAIELFLSHHAMVHTAKIQADEQESFQDEVLQGLTDEQMRYVPAGHANSAAWMLWHITRIEDAAINVLLADAPQVFHRGNWQSKLNSPCADVGNEMSAEEIRALSEAVNLKELLAYRLEVGKHTRQVAGQLTAETLKRKPSPDRLKRLAEDGTVREQAQWLLEYWGGHPQWNLLLMPATRHSFVHFNEIGRMLPTLRRLPGK